MRGGFLAKERETTGGIEADPTVAVVEHLGDGLEVAYAEIVERRELAASPAADRLVLAGGDAGGHPLAQRRNIDQRHSLGDFQLRQVNVAADVDRQHGTLVPDSVPLVQ